MYVNTHIHTPFSFSSFDSIEQAILQAKKENVAALGINDFNTIDGHNEFALRCGEYGIYPLFNIEFITLHEEDKLKGLRWNDPANPGIMYFIGKALNYPVSFNKDSKNLLASLWKGTQDRIWKMIHNLNDILSSHKLDVQISYTEIRNHFATQAVRERHLAKALFVAFQNKWLESSVRLEKYRSLFNDPTFNADVADSVSMQNEIRNHLLKAGKPAYAEEKFDAFLRLHEAKTIVLKAGGIPCYPFLLDSSCEMTENEKNISSLYQKLLDAEIYAVEFISNRVDFDRLKMYARFFKEKGFCVTFGTEHNTPGKISLIPGCAGGVQFDAELSKMAFEGACIHAAHQELHKQKLSGFIDEYGKRLVPQNRIRDFMRTGEDAIKKSTGKLFVNPSKYSYS
jgi:hypothetical protein